MDTRRELLISLLEGNRPINELRRALAEYPWDCQHPLVTLTVSNVQEMMQRFLHGACSPRDLEDWADAVESREDIGLEEGRDELLVDVLQQLANPELFDPLTTEHVSTLVRRLEAAS